MTSPRELRDLEDLLDKAPPLPQCAEYASFEAFCDAVERLMQITSIDGMEERDGYSLDSVYSAWLARFTPAEYAQGKRA